MRIETIEFFENYRGINADIIDFTGTENYCAIVGLNGSGKTSVIACIRDSYRKDDDQTLPVITYENNVKPKLITHIYNGESEFGSRLLPSKYDDTIILQLDSSIWFLASYILQIQNDSLIDKYNLKSTDVEEDLQQIKYYSALSFWAKMLESIEIPLKHKSKNNNVLNAVYSYIDYKAPDYKKGDDGAKNLHSFDHKPLEVLYPNTLKLSEGQKAHLVLQLVMKYLADDDTLILLDEPDAYLDIQKKKELFNMVEACKGQVILTTHDPIMTYWMKDHLIFMRNGKQIPSDLVHTVKEMSGCEVSYQENLLMFQKEYLVIVEGKSDIACIEKAIRSNGLTSDFEQVFFLAQNSAQNTKATFDNLLCKMFSNNNPIKKILFLFDADDGGDKGKAQIKDIKAEKPNEDIAHKIDYLFYRPCYTENDIFDNNVKDYFYLEGYFPVECYPGNKGATINLIKHEELYNILDDKSEDKYLNFNEINRLKFFADAINKKNGLKAYFRDQTDKIDERFFLGFRPLLDKILEKLESSQ